MPPCCDGEDSDVDCLDTSCEAMYGPGVCKTVAHDTRYAAMKSECDMLLRQLRAIRRDKGYLPYHGVLLVVAKDDSSILQVHLLCRLSFSPFDFTAVQMQVPPGVASLPLRATTLVLTDGSPSLRSMAQLLCGLIGAGERDIVLATAAYRAVALGAVIVEGEIQMLSTLRPPVPVRGNNQGSDSDSDEAELNQRRALLKRADSGKRDPQPKKRRRVPSGPKNNPKSRPKPKTKAAARPSNLGASDKVDAETEQAWLNAIEDEAGPVVEPSRSSSSSSRPSAPPSQPRPDIQSAGINHPDHLEGVPWKDDQGHCWVMARSGDAMPTKRYHLGILAAFACSIYAPCLFCHYRYC